MKRAFTLIELLVVIAIIGLISSIALSSLNASRAKANDARRLSDMREIQKALEGFAIDNGGSYPNTLGGWRSECSGYQPQFVIYDNSISKGIVPTYIGKFPTDPEMKNTGTYNTSTCCYAYQSDGIDYDIVDYTCPTSAATSGALPSLQNSNFPSMWSVHTSGAVAKNF